MFLNSETSSEQTRIPQYVRRVCNRFMKRKGKALYQAGWFPPPAPQGLLLCLPREVTKRGQFRFSIRSECRMRAHTEFEQGGTMNPRFASTLSQKEQSRTSQAGAQNSRTRYRHRYPVEAEHKDQSKAGLLRTAERREDLFS